jgi:hypothetical protein
VSRVSTSLGHLSMSVPRVSTSLVHLIHVGPTCLTSGSHLCHMTTPHWSTSPSPCHMAEHSLTQSDLLETHDSTSLVHITGHITTPATWQPVNGPQQQGRCHMAAHREATLACQCHMAVFYWSTSARWVLPLYWPNMWVPPTCHVAGSDRSTSALTCHMAALQQHTSAPQCHMAVGHWCQITVDQDTWHSLPNATSAYIDTNTGD